MSSPAAASARSAIGPTAGRAGAPDCRSRVASRARGGHRRDGIVRRPIRIDRRRHRRSQPRRRDTAPRCRRPAGSSSGSWRRRRRRRSSAPRPSPRRAHRRASSIAVTSPRRLAAAVANRQQLVARAGSRRRPDRRRRRPRSTSGSTLVAAPTEHAGVRRRSIEALAQLRHAGGDELHLRSGQRAARPVRDRPSRGSGCTARRPASTAAACSPGTDVNAWTTAATCVGRARDPDPVEHRGHEVGRNDA